MFEHLFIIILLFSRNNSTSQTDYTKAKITPLGPPPPTAAGAPFKPIPPPKPKNYRAPMQGGTNGNQWENVVSLFFDRGFE
jgi:tight junction protein 1